MNNMIVDVTADVRRDIAALERTRWWHRRDRKAILDRMSRSLRTLSQYIEHAKATDEERAEARRVLNAGEAKYLQYGGQAS